VSFQRLREVGRAVRYKIARKLLTAANSYGKARHFLELIESVPACERALPGGGRKQAS